MSRFPLVKVIGAISLVVLTVVSRSAADDEPLNVGGDVRAPELVSRVEPEYPKKAREAGVTGIVILNAVINTEGRVTRITVVKSIPLLDHAAIEAVQQWKYKPATQNSRPVPVYLSIALSFPPAGGAAAPTHREGMLGAGEGDEVYDVGGDVHGPVLVTKVTPEYVEEARRAKVEGNVILDMIIDAEGNVVNPVVTRSVPMLDDAAIACVKKWKFKPATKDGRPVRVRWMIVITFSLR